MKTGRSAHKRILAAPRWLRLGRALKWSLPAVERTGYADDAEIPAWAKPYVQAAFDHHVLIGLEDNRFAPNMQTTRAEMAVALLRVWKLIKP